MTFALKRLFRLDTRVRLEIPLCRTHRSKRILRRWLGLFLAACGLALLPFAVKAIEVRTPLEALTWGGTLALILAGLILGLTGVHILDLVELNDQFAAYRGFGLGYMEKIPSEREVFSAGHN